MPHLVLIGAGPHGLAVLSAIADGGSWPERVTVVDPSAPQWCTAWDAKLARLALDRLRSPQVHHPGPRPMQLRDMVEVLPEEQQLQLRRPEAERAPTPEGMHRFIDTLAAGLGPIEWVRGVATSITVDPAGLPVVTVALASADPAADGTAAASPTTTLRPDAVVLAHNPSFARIPDWAAPLIAKGAAEHASTVDMRSAAVDGREVLIVGGGLTAACLALETVRRGGNATVLTRRPLRARPYDVDASWIGPRRLAGYRATPLPERRVLIDVARDGGTIPPRTLDELRARAAAAPETRAARPAGATPPEGHLTLLEAADDIAAHVDAAVAAEPGRPPLLWFATGFEQDVLRDPLVAPLVDALRVATYGGLPAVSEDLRLDDAAIFVTGPYAALGVGPACRNLAGARPAAARISAALRSRRTRDS